MKKPRMSRKKAILFIAALCAISALQASCNKAVESKKTARAQVIEGHRTGIAVNEVKRQLREMNTKDYETDFSDLIVYDPSPDTEIKLLFTCSTDGPVVAKVERLKAIPGLKNGPVLTRIKDELIAEYGAPTISESQADGFDLCWGQCAQGEDGSTIKAKTSALRVKKRALSLTISNNTLVRECAKLRPKKINTWLYQWMAVVQKFKPGMSLRDASALYRKRYQDPLVVDEQRDETFQKNPVATYVVNDYDFFAGLDYESQFFEGDGPGTIVLKFTGDHAGHGGMLNRKLYSMSFSTTKFTDLHNYTDVKQKLDTFIKTYGPPAEVIQQPDGIAARWQHDAERGSVRIFDSGLITFEQSDQALKEAYREAAVKKVNEYTVAGSYAKEGQSWTEHTVFNHNNVRHEQGTIDGR